MDKLQEIRKALEAAKPEEGKNYYEYLRAKEHLRNHTPEYLSYLLSELDEKEQVIGDLEHQLEDVTEWSMKRKYEVEELTNQNKRIHATKEAMFENRETWRKSHEDLTVEMNTMEQRLKQAIEALEWYADHRNHPPLWVHDGGETARKALALILQEVGNPSLES